MFIINDITQLIGTILVIKKSVKLSMQNQHQRGLFLEYVLCVNVKFLKFLKRILMKF